MLNNVILDDIQRIYHSPLVRARDTARIISAIYEIGLEECECLREVKRNFGFVDAEIYSEYVTEYLSGFNNSRFEGYEKAEERILTCIESLVKDSAGKSLMIVSHGLILTVFYSYILGKRTFTSIWREIKMPDLAVLNLDSGVIETGSFLEERSLNRLRFKWNPDR